MRGKFLSGKFNPVNPQKYKGDVTNIVYRSSYELAVFRLMDDDDGIIYWSSEEIYIPYISGVDGRAHRYFVDLVALVRDENGNLRKKYIEIKPYNQTIPPKRTKTEKQESYVEKVRTYITNQSKWEAAKKYAAERNADFVVITEREIFPKPIKRMKAHKPKVKIPRFKG